VKVVTIGSKGQETEGKVENERGDKVLNATTIIASKRRVTAWALYR